MFDKVLLQKIKIWLKLPVECKQNEKEINSNYANIILVWEQDVLIIKSIYIQPECRGKKIWTNLVSELENLHINIKVQSVLNKSLLTSMNKRGWETLNEELSVYFPKYLSKIN